MEVTSRFLRPSRVRFSLVDPLGTGESSWIPALSIGSSASTSSTRSLSARPERLSGLVEGNPYRGEPSVAVVVQEVAVGHPGGDSGGRTRTRERSTVTIAPRSRSAA